MLTKTSFSRENKKQFKVSNKSTKNIVQLLPETPDKGTEDAGDDAPASNPLAEIFTAAVRSCSFSFPLFFERFKSGRRQEWIRRRKAQWTFLPRPSALGVLIMEKWSSPSDSSTVEVKMSATLIRWFRKTRTKHTKVHILAKAASLA